MLTYNEVDFHRALTARGTVVSGSWLLRDILARNGGCSDFHVNDFDIFVRNERALLDKLREEGYEIRDVPILLYGGRGYLIKLFYAHRPGRIPVNVIVYDASYTPRQVVRSFDLSVVQNYYCPGTGELHIEYPEDVEDRAFSIVNLKKSTPHRAKRYISRKGFRSRSAD